LKFEKNNDFLIFFRGGLKQTRGQIPNKGMSVLRSPGRMLALFCLGGAVLVGLGFAYGGGSSAGGGGAGLADSGGSAGGGSGRGSVASSGASTAGGGELRLPVAGGGGGKTGGLSKSDRSVGGGSVRVPAASSGKSAGDRSVRVPASSSGSSPASAKPPPAPRPSKARAPAPAAPFFTPSFLWTGSWEEEGNLANRIDLRLTALGFTARAQALDRRYSPFKEGWQDNWDEQAPAYSGGLYHKKTGSRLLYGVLEEWGLSARIKNSWAKSLAYPAARKPLGADLKTAYTSTGSDEAYLYLSTGRIGAGEIALTPSASLWLDEEGSPALGAGLDARFGKAGLRTEAFYTRKTLPEKSASSWFSDPPPLPERETEIFGTGVLFTAPWFALAADGALSRTYAWGEDYYGNLALSLGTKPWQLSLGVEAAGERFSDRGGSDIGAGFRAGARFEWKLKRSGLFKVDAVLNAPSSEEAFNRSALSLYFRFPAAPKSASLALFRPVRISLSAARDGRDLAKIKDSAAAVFSWRTGPLGFAINGSLEGRAAGSAAEAGEFTPFPVAADHDFSYAAAAAEISFSPGIFQFRLKSGRSWTAGKDTVQDASLSGSVNVKNARFTMKISSPAFPDEWTGQISWRLNF
jgi:hypothetical protein